MKKRHYIQLAILLIIAFIYVSIKTGDLRFEQVRIEEPSVTTFIINSTESYHLGDDPPNKVIGNKTGYAEVSYQGEIIKLDRSDYGPDEEFKSAIEEAKQKLKKPSPDDVEVLIEIDNSEPAVITTNQ